MIISATLAQKIVDNIKPIALHNINIMNNSGMIIASGQGSRINTYHQGAMDVINTGVCVEIYPENIGQYPGALPGLNLPIEFGDQVVGVVGVSGHPDLVRNTANLVKLVTELILERESLIAEFRSNLQLREQFIHLLLDGRYQENYIQITKLASLLRFKLELSRIVAVVNVRGILADALRQYGTHDLVISRTRESLIQLLESSSLVDDRDLVVCTSEELIILRHYPVDISTDKLSQWGLDVIQLLQGDNQYEGLCLGLGSLTPLPPGLYTSYTEAVFSLRHNLGNTPVASIYNFDILVAYLIRVPGALDSCLAIRGLQQILADKLDFKYDMRNTVNTLLNNNLNVSKTAKALYIHRNTLVFRLEKLKEMTGLCPDQLVNHAMLCKILFND
ncbi:MAG: transcriptional regulator, CdaR [Sporomusa sp.]|jgi:carbohydrate diacid regulator|nr:transcriptional regulator, CdaR [Sporomusa sp.]